MKQFRSNVIRAGLEALYLTRAHHLLGPIFAGVGTIFTLHHVRPPRQDEFQPNRHLEVTPDFLRAMLSHLRASKIDIISMDDLHRRLTERNLSRRFACFTFDDGYRDNRDYALAVMRDFDAPLTVLVVSDFAEGVGRLWWIALEMVIARTPSIDIEIEGVGTHLDTSTLARKQAAFDRLHDWLRGLPGKDDLEREIVQLLMTHTDGARASTETLVAGLGTIRSEVQTLRSEVLTLREEALADPAEEARWVGVLRAIGAGDGIFHQRLLSADGNQLVPGRLGAAVPGFAEERDVRLGMHRQVDPRRGQSGGSVRCLPDALECSCPRLFLQLCRGGDVLWVAGLMGTVVSSDQDAEQQMQRAEAET